MMWLTLQEAAERARWNTRTIERYIAAGKLPAFKHGRSVRVRSTDLDALFKPLAVAK